MKAFVAFMMMMSVVVRAQHDWADPIDRIDYPQLDIGYYPVIEGQGNCHKCLAYTKKSIFAQNNPDCRVILFEGMPPSKKNMVKMAQAGNCYEDNP